MSAKADNFKRLSASRLANVLTAIRVLGNLSSNNYEYTPDQVRDLFHEIDCARDEIFNKFGGRNARQDSHLPSRLDGADVPDSVSNSDDQHDDYTDLHDGVVGNGIHPRKLSFMEIQAEIASEQYQLEEALDLLAIYRVTYGHL